MRAVVGPVVVVITARTLPAQATLLLLLTAAAAQEGDTLEGTVWQTNGTGLDYTFECIGNTKASCDV